MKNFFRLAGALLAAFVIVLSSKEAHALGPLDIEVGAKVGYATNPSSAPTSPNALGIGIGGRAGVSIFGLYGGVNIVDYLGGTNNGVSESALQLGGELGYSIKLTVLTIRPQIGLGNISFNTSGSIAGISIPSTSSGSFYLEPGLTALITIGIIYFGADANALIITDAPAPNAPAGTQTVFTLHGQIGLTF